MNSQRIGQQAENAACEYLHRHGLRTICRNFHCRFGEIDIIMRDGAVLVFVEVRFRQTRRYGRPAETVDGRKQQRLGRTAQVFLQKNPEYAQHELRFDVIAMEPARGPGRAYDIDWIRQAFEFQSLSI